MVDDGMNDAPALATVDFGFATGGGADIAVESADVTLVGDDIARVATGIDLSRRTMKIIRRTSSGRWATTSSPAPSPAASTR